MGFGNNPQAHNTTFPEMYQDEQNSNPALARGSPADSAMFRQALQGAGGPPSPKDLKAMQEQQAMQAQQALAAPLSAMGLNTPAQLVGLINLLHGTQRVVNNVFTDPGDKIRSMMYQVVGLNPEGMKHLGNVTSATVNGAIQPLIREQIKQNLAPQNNAYTEAMLQYIAQLSDKRRGQVK